RDNPFAKEYPMFNSSELGRGNANRVDTADNGIFRTVTTPGPVLLMGGFDYTRSTGKFVEDMKYKSPLPDAKYPQYFEKFKRHAEYYVFGGGVSLVQGHFCKVLEIKPGTAVVHQDILLEHSSALEVKIQDAEGRPVSGTWATGIDSENIY